MKSITELKGASLTQLESALAALEAEEIALAALEAAEAKRGRPQPMKQEKVA
jgi:hypothetical protein